MRAPDRSRAGRWGTPPGFAIAAALIALTGLATMLYPGTAAWWAQLEQSRVIAEVAAAASDAPAHQRGEELARARTYNSRLASGARIGASSRKPSAVTKSNGEAGDEAELYRSLLRGDAAGVMGRIRIPAIAVDLPIFHGTDDATLLRGVGHLEGTSLPVGGASQHAVLTAHRGLSSAALFTDLDRVSRGDTFVIEVFGEVLSYRVIDTRVVAPEDTDSLFPRQGEDLVTLVTCTPLGINTQRILVTGERILPTPKTDIDRAGDAPGIPAFPWWAVGFGAGVAVIAGYLVWSTRREERPARGKGSEARRYRTAAEGEEGEDGEEGEEGEATGVMR